MGGLGFWFRGFLAQSLFRSRVSKVSAFTDLHVNAHASQDACLWVFAWAMGVCETGGNLWVPIIRISMRVP